MQPQNKINRYEELDCLRGAAALAVVLFHFTFGYDNGLNILREDKFYFSYGYLGVQLFFLISGFVIFMTLEKTKHPFDFIVSRLSRLYPAYWAAIMCTVLFTTALSVPFQQGIYSASQVLINFSMLQYFFKIKDVDGAYWTLAVELTFYVLMWGVFLAKQQKRILPICLAWLLLSVIFSMHDIPLENYLNVIFIFKHAPLFVGGIGFYLLRTKQSTPSIHFLVIASLLAEYIQILYTKNIPTIYVIVAFFYLVFYLFVYRRLEFIKHKSLLFIGAISYPLYLIHENIGMAVIYWLKQLLDVQIFYLPITLVFVIALATLITFYIERPAMVWIRQKYRDTFILQ